MRGYKGDHQRNKSEQSPNTTFPSFTVTNTFKLSKLAGQMVKGLLFKMAKSAIFPTSIDPFLDYQWHCQAGFMVRAFNAQQTGILWVPSSSSLPPSVTLLTAADMSFKKVLTPLNMPESTTGESLWRVNFIFLLRADPAGFILFARLGPRNILQCLSPQQQRWAGKKEGLMSNPGNLSSWSSLTVCAWIMMTLGLLVECVLFLAHSSAFSMLSVVASPLQ